MAKSRTLSHTLLVVDAGAEKAVPWTKPDSGLLLINGEYSDKRPNIGGYCAVRVVRPEEILLGSNGGEFYR